MTAPLQETLTPLLAAWLLLAAAALYSRRQDLGLERGLLWASLRGLLQLLLLAWILQWVFAIEATALQAMLIAGFCLLAAHTSAAHGDGSRGLWIACAVGLMAGNALTLPWLVLCGAIGADSRHLIPLGSMIAANGMNALSLLLIRLQHEGQPAHFGQALHAAMTPPIDTLRMVGLVHMPGIFVGMVLAGSTALEAATAQLVILYMVVASSFFACVVMLLVHNHLRKAQTSSP